MTHGGDKRQGCSVCGATPAYFDCEGGPAYTRCLLKRVQELEAAARSHEAQPSVTPKEWQHLIAVAREEGFLAGKLDAAKSTGAAPDFGDRMRAKGFAEAPSKRDAAASSMAEPLCYCLVNAAGDMYWDSESCIWSDPGEADGALDCQQDAEPDAGWRIAALYDAAPSATRETNEHPWKGALEGTVAKMGPLCEAAERFAKAHIESDRLDKLDDSGSAPEAAYQRADAEYNSAKAALVKTYKLMRAADGSKA